MKLFYKIGEFAKLCEVSVKTLRYYETLGLLIPAEVDEWTGYRSYHIGQLQRMETIRNLKSVGFTLDEIGEQMESNAAVPRQEILETKLRQTESQMNDLMLRREKIQSMIYLQDNSRHMADITIQSLPPITVASYKVTVQSSDQIGTLYRNIIGPEMDRVGCEYAEPEYFFIQKGHSNGISQDIEIAYCKQVKKALEDSDLVKFRTLEKVDMAMCMKVHGPYEQIEQRLIDLFSHIENEHYTIIGEPRICYVDGIWNQEDPNRWTTIIQVPIGKHRRRLPLNRLRLFCCPSCGNVSFAYGKTSMECCGQTLEPAELHPEEEALFTATEMDGEYLLHFNSPMTKDNYIAAVIVERHDSCTLFRLFPEGDSQVRIPMLAGSKIYALHRADGSVWATVQ